MLQVVYTCEDCIYFHQHYVRHSDNCYVMAGSGHCVYPRRRPRYNESKTCQYFQLNPEPRPQEEW